MLLPVLNSREQGFDWTAVASTIILSQEGSFPCKSRSSEQSLVLHFLLLKQSLVWIFPSMETWSRVCSLAAEEPRNWILSFQAGT